MYEQRLVTVLWALRDPSGTFVYFQLKQMIHSHGQYVSNAKISD